MHVYALVRYYGLYRGCWQASFWDCGVVVSERLVVRRRGSGDAAIVAALPRDRRPSADCVVGYIVRNRGELVAGAARLRSGVRAPPSRWMTYSAGREMVSRQRACTGN